MASLTHVETLTLENGNDFEPKDQAPPTSRTTTTTSSSVSLFTEHETETDVHPREDQSSLSSNHVMTSLISPPVKYSTQSRPSFLNLNGNTGLHPAANYQFDYNVIKRLDAVFDDTATDIFEEEKLKTFLRIRPTSSSSKKDGEKGELKNKKTQKKDVKVLEIKDSTTVIGYPHQKNLYSFLGGRDTGKQTEFKFTKVLGPDTGQSAVFEECVATLIDKFLKGENCLIFSYGTTNSGKTYTLQGHGTDYGIIPRALDAIFARVQDRVYRTLDVKPYLYHSFHQISPREREMITKKKERLLLEVAAFKKAQGLDGKSNESFAGSQYSKSGSSVSLIGGGPFDEMNYALFANTNLFSIWVSYAELYNERVYDLLETVYIGDKKRRKELKLMQDKNGYVYIRDLTEIQVTSDEEAYKIYLAGRKNLQFASTQMNQYSSRSHSFFTLRVVTIGIGEGLLPFPRNVHRITFCDLAGMERVYQTENEGMRLKESGTINSSLTVLLKVIRILREKQKAGKAMLETIPFRESKLTHIFKSFFLSPTHIRMIVNVNPDPSMAESTLQVLHNSSIASNVIAFRPMNVVDVNIKSDLNLKPNLKGNMDQKKKNENESKKKKVEFESWESSDSSEDNDNVDLSHSSDSSKAGPTTVIPASKALLLNQRIHQLERENAELRKKLALAELEKERIREESVKLLTEQNRLWSKRFADTKVQQNHLNDRRISLLQNRVLYSPGSKCGRNYTPPRLDLDELLEDPDEEEVDFYSEADKENRPPRDSFV